MANRHSYKVRKTSSLLFSLLPLLLAWSTNLGLVGCTGLTPASPKPGQHGASIAVAASSIAFGSVAIGTTNTQTLTVSNPGNRNLVISQAVVNGPGFSLSGLSVPFTITPGQSVTVAVGFTPSTGGSSLSGTLTLVSNAPTTPLAIPLSGKGAVILLAASPSSLSFGNSAGTSGPQSVTLTNTGASNVSISQITSSEAAFSFTGLALPATLSPGQTASFNVLFAPTSLGTQTGSVTVWSTAANSPATISTTGRRLQPITHSVTLSWEASTSMVVGYYVYRGMQLGGPYTKLNNSALAAVFFPDATVEAGRTYFYVVTAVDSSALESEFSTEVSATIPTP
jgi:hypothetical protein